MKESGEDGREFGDVFLVVDDWTTLRDEYEQLEEPITALAARGLGFGIHVIVSSNSCDGRARAAARRHRHPLRAAPRRPGRLL